MCAAPSRSILCSWRGPLTIHKSQGLTFSNVRIDLGEGAFSSGQAYVALSRCRSLEGMSLVSTINERDIFVNPAIVRFSHTFNDSALIASALERARADDEYARALESVRGGDLAGAFDHFTEALRCRKRAWQRAYDEVCPHAVAARGEYGRRN